MTGFTKEEIAELLDINVKDVVDKDIDCFNEVFFRDEALYFHFVQRSYTGIY